MLEKIINLKNKLVKYYKKQKIKIKEIDYLDHSFLIYIDNYIYGIYLLKWDTNKNISLSIYKRPNNDLYFTEQILDQELKDKNEFEEIKKLINKSINYKQNLFNWNDY